MIARGAGEPAPAEVDERWVVAFDRTLLRAALVRTHEGSPSDFPADQAAPLRGGVGPAHRAERDAEPVGELALGGKAIAGDEGAGLDVPGEGVGEGEVLGFGLGGE